MSIAEYVVAVEQSYESVAVPTGMDLDLLKKMTLTRGIRDEELEIQILQSMPEAFTLAVEQLRDLEDVLRKVRGPKFAKIIEETKSKPTIKKVSWDTSDISEIAETTIGEKFKGKLDEVIQEMKTLTRKVDKVAAAGSLKDISSMDAKVT